jgi:hypothetical protein
VKGQTGKPQPFGPAVNRLLFVQGDFGVAKEGSEKKNFQGQAPDHTPEIMRVFEETGPNPGESPLLAAARGDPERDRGFGPADHPIDHSSQKDKQRCARNPNAEKGLPLCLARSDVSDQNERKNGKQGESDMQEAAPQKELFTAESS